ncbi:MAG: 23S rRNA (adenine(2503)-C(2))-methyltransferase [Nitrospirae bacterium RBG_19FT_COMBO_42_15]|nr:MAG: 23S rRNA (adenine(2503)-C(2))-methyltransferase [Nitrospirae bacterium RBG_19FT_COMBO_42_15]
MKNLKSFSSPELEAFLISLGMKRYRANQVYQWLYQKGAASFDEMTNLSKEERTALNEKVYISSLILIKKQTASDGTEKYLFELEDGNRIESVLIPDEKRLTLCISTQVGCSMGCRFCLTGKGGLKRNLEAHEIVDQALAVKGLLNKRITNIVLMGMGEPLANYDNTIAALKILLDEKALNFSSRKITLSTAGLIPQIDKLGKEGVKVNLAISLNAATDDVRNKIMPINKKYPIKELIACCKRFPLPKRRRITFEYVMLKDINDTKEDAERLCKLLKGVPCKVNLIPFNEYEGCEFKKPDEKSVERFRGILIEHHIMSITRKSKGAEISAACGQLRGSN